MLAILGCGPMGVLCGCLVAYLRASSVRISEASSGRGVMSVYSCKKEAA
jgi:hypothetical protein